MPTIPSLGRAALRCVLALTTVAIAASASAQHGDHASAPAPPSGVPLYAGLGEAHFAITTFRADAQSYFDQGLRWMHAFNLEEAEASFREALRRDPSCALCAWGVAFSLGPHINLPALPERTVAAAAAMRDAARLAAAGDTAATPLERGLIDAMARRSSDPAPATPDAQATLDSAYAEAMRGLASRHPRIAEVQFLLAESLMDLHPWDLYDPTTGAPRPWTPEIVGAVERGLALDAGHPGLHHLYIHAVEASTTPQRAVRSADLLARAMPDAAHVVHMPGHIYQRVGRYADAALANERAVAVDGSYLGQASPNVAFYRMIYAPHNLDFLAAATGMEGRGAATLLAVRAIQEHLSAEMLRQMPGFDFVLAKPAWTLLRFGRLADAIAEPLPPEEFPFALAMAHAARALAHARLGRIEEAEASRSAMAAALARTSGDAPQGLNTVAGLSAVASNLVSGELAAARGEEATAQKWFAAAGPAEDAIRYNEPSDWYFPARHWVGSTLLRLGRVADAEAIFRADLERNPENGWALAGLAAALERQPGRSGATEVRARLATAWAKADLGLERVVAPIRP